MNTFISRLPLSPITSTPLKPYLSARSQPKKNVLLQESIVEVNKKNELSALERKMKVYFVD